MSRRSIIIGLALGSFAVSACTSQSDSPGSPTAPGPISSQRLTIEHIASSASAFGIQGSRWSTQAPASSGGPALTVSGNQRIINGGTLLVNVAASAPVDRVFVRVGGRTLGLAGESAGGVQGYYEVRLPSPQTMTGVLLAFPQEIPLSQFDLQFAAVSPSGAIGPYVPLTTTVTPVGTGDVQVTLSWDVDSDVDLHVVAPGGEEVFYGRRRAASGGELDLDSNAGCAIDGVRNENITWPIGRAPRGVYAVRVNYWANCGVPGTNYTVRINNGGNVQIFSGTFTGPGDRGGAGSGRTIATFERQSGPTASSPPLLEALVPTVTKTAPSAESR